MDELFSSSSSSFGYSGILYLPTSSFCMNSVNYTSDSMSWAARCKVKARRSNTPMEVADTIACVNSWLRNFEDFIIFAVRRHSFARSCIPNILDTFFSIRYF